MEQEAVATPEQFRAIEIARAMADAGIPIFVCPPNPYRPGKYFLKAGWQNVIADPSVLDLWRPGWAVAAVGGHAADFLDMDPRAGGLESQAILKAEGDWPLSFGTQSTPSGGTHDVISACEIGKETGFMPGLDLQGGLSQPDAKGETHRAFVWLAPTVGRSRETGELVPYRWVYEPDLDALDEWRMGGDGSSDHSTEGVVARVMASRARRAVGEVATKVAERNRDALMDGNAFLSASGGGRREFTQAQAEAFVEPHLLALGAARIGEINEMGMRATLAIEHFVPEFWTPEQAGAVILDWLGRTAYDPNGPSDWTADQQFISRLDGRRPVKDSWKAVRAEQGGEGGSEEVAGDAVDALLAEMLSPAQIIARPAPRALIKGLLNLDSESWLIGAPGAKKSFVALDMAAHVAAGMDWQNRRTTQGPVVIIAAEGAGGLGPRIAAWQMRHGPMNVHVHILPRPVQAADRGAWAVLVRACERLGAVLVVADTQARMTVGLEENSATEMGVYIEAVRAIREATGACVLSVHHTGRGGGDARGSSAIDGAQFTELKVVAERGSLVGKLVTEKQKDMEEAADIPLTFEQVETGLLDEDGQEIRSLVLRRNNPFVGASSLMGEVEPWERFHGETQVHVLKVLRDQAGTIGLTKTEVRGMVIERFLGGDAKRLARSTWGTAWTRVLEKRTASGDPVAVNLGGQRWGLDPLAFDAWNVAKSEEADT